MKLIVGLGNPGKKYAKTRHNAGWLVLDALAKKAQSSKLKVQSYNSKFRINKNLKSAVYEGKIGNQRVVLAKPLTYMNSSGAAVKSLYTKYQILNTNLYVVHDDLDLPLGSFKIQFGKGPKEHKGVESVEKALRTKDFWRVRVGIEARMSNVKCQMSNVSGEEYVLGQFTKKELAILEKTIPKIVEKVLEKMTVSN